MRVTTSLPGSSPGERFDLFVALRRLPAWTTVAMVVGWLLVVFAADRTTEAAPVQHLYYLAIVLAGLRFGLRGGVTTAVSATALYHLANPRLLTFTYGEGDLVQMTLFLAIGLVTARLATDARRVRRLSMTDDLTGLYNLRAFEIALARMLRRSHEARAPLALIVLDVDHLKVLNDRHGHLAGADAVRTVGHVVAAWTPSGAVACRYGGDEFVVVLPSCSKAEAIVRSNDLRRAVQRAAPVLAGLAFPAGALTVSVGVAGGEPHPSPILAGALTSHWLTGAGEALFRSADAALYRAKEGGRNRTCAA